MKSLETTINPIIDELIVNTNSYFIELLAAHVMYELGRYSMDNIDDRSSIIPKVGVDLHIEPIPISSIKGFKDYYPHFLLEVFHGKFCFLWNEFLTKIFSILIELHFLKKRKFKELKKQEVKLDFTSDQNFDNQIKIGIVEDFNFKEYSERQKVINKILNPDNEGQTELANIYKNILIRNTIQHRKNIVDSYILKKLGVAEIKILNNSVDLLSYELGNKIMLSIPEINAFKKSILFIAQIWRIKNV